MSKIKVRNALESLVNAWAIAQTPPVAIAWENFGFKPPANMPWAQVTLIPADTVSGSFAAAEYKGLLHINVFGVVDIGAGAIDRMAESLAAIFPAGLDVNGVRISRPPSVGQGRTDPNGWYMVPVRARYQLN